MFLSELSESFNVNEKGNFTIGGVDTVLLSNEYKTPLYVMDEDMIRKNCRLFKRSIEDFYGGNGLVCYASKAFCCKEIYRIMKSEGLGVDVVSIGELYTAVSAGFDPKNICLHGNNKTDDELRFALEKRVGRIVIDNLNEMKRLDKEAEKLGIKPNVLLRIKPGIDAHTHDFIRTGQIDSKFGFALETGEAFEAVGLALSSKNLNLVGLHCHIGSQIFDVSPFVLAAEVMMDFRAEIKDKFSKELKELNLGGGFGIRYTSDEDPIGLDEYMKAVSEAIKKKANETKTSIPFILLEPGRSIVASAGATLYTVGNRKEIPEVRTYISVDGGMTDNPRYALYKSKYEAVVANKASLPRDEKVTLAGKCCESGDLLGENMEVQKAEVGDIIAVLATGAYNYSMASHYNRIANPAVVMVSGGKSRVIVKRESLEDLTKNDI